jgi:HEAT repeat protein
MKQKRIKTSSLLLVALLILLASACSEKKSSSPLKDESQAVQEPALPELDGVAATLVSQFDINIDVSKMNTPEVPNALEHLGNLKDPQTIPHIAALLKKTGARIINEDDTHTINLIHGAAIKSLGKIGDESAIPIIVEFSLSNGFAHPDGIKALQNIGTDNAALKLIELFPGMTDPQDPGLMHLSHGYLKDIALKALVEMRTPVALPVFREIFNEMSDINVHDRIFPSALGLGRVGNEEDHELLVSVLADGRHNHWGEEAAALGLLEVKETKNLNNENVAVVLEIFIRSIDCNIESRVAAAYAYGKIFGPKANAFAETLIKQSKKITPLSWQAQNFLLGVAILGETGDSTNRQKLQSFQEMKNLNHSEQHEVRVAIEKLSASKLERAFQSDIIFSFSDSDKQAIKYSDIFKNYPELLNPDGTLRPNIGYFNVNIFFQDGKLSAIDTTISENKYQDPSEENEKNRIEEKKKIQKIKEDLTKDHCFINIRINSYDKKSISNSLALTGKYSGINEFQYNFTLEKTTQYLYSNGGSTDYREYSFSRSAHFGNIDAWTWPIYTIVCTLKGNTLHGKPVRSNLVSVEDVRRIIGSDRILIYQDKK